MLRKLPFRSRLVLVVSVPLLVLLVFAGVTIKDRFDALSSERQYSALVGPFQALTDASQALGDQAVLSADPRATSNELAAARHRTEATAAALDAAMPKLTGNVSPHTRRAVEDVSNRIAEGGAFVATASDALAAAARVAREVDDPKLSDSLGAIVDLRREELAIADESAIVTAQLAGGSPSLDAWVNSIIDQREQSRLFGEAATGAERAAYTRSGATALPRDPVRAAVDGVLPRAFPSVDTTVADYRALYAQKEALTSRGVTAVQAVVNDEAQQRESETKGVAIVVALGSAAMIWAVLMLLWGLLRSVNKPLRALTRSARALSEHRLPMLVDTLRRGGELGAEQLADFTPIRVESNDEIGGLAKAFNTMQQVTVTVAREQSELLKKGIGDLYVNLARRNQSLLDRQISLLDDLETQADPDELISLFELDHLATRMRRNAESLLVLSGSEQPRHWGSAVPVIDVVRGAAAEIADFARLHAQGFDPDLAVNGPAVADVTHLLAELLENATAFSPPGTPVNVTARRIDDRLAITITDAGIGMDDNRLTAANALLARPPVIGLALSRTLGLHVVAHLASRHGVHVQLRRAEPSGIAAIVLLPAALLVASPSSQAADPWSAPTEPSSGPVRAEIVPPAPAETAPVEAMAVEPRTEPEPEPEPEPVRHPEPEPALLGASAEAFPRRATHVGANGNGAHPGSNGNGLTARVPGTNLTHRPDPDAVPSADVRPRPERVQDLLSRHERGKRDGQLKGGGA